MLLLNPGPVTLTERVRRSLLQPDLCHRESEFFALQDEIRERLLATYHLDPQVWTAVLMTGSGTAAVESMMAALVPANGRLLNFENGVYGERIAQMCAQYGIAHERAIGSWMEPITLPAAPAGFTHAAIVHHETTTGRLNDLKPVIKLCHERGMGLLVDGVSSFGAENIDFGAECLHAVAATANKCLHGVPGASFVIARRTALAKAASRTYYLDLGRLARLQEQRNTPFTPAVHAYYALVEALREFADEGGRAARYQRYAALAEQVRAGLADLGIHPVIAPEQSSVVLRSYHLPPQTPYSQLHDALKAQGFVIYAGQGDLSKMLFRISTMGAVTCADMNRLLKCFAQRG
ncbi:MAG: 2-aminoethylphosphonate aminotransferase [Proteobacteria bacterium]|nr:2-aminoethylphosphonate aminotransferase [Pseudomonadota bacterium]